MYLGKGSVAAIRGMLKESIVTFHYYSELGNLEAAREQWGRKCALDTVRVELKIPFSNADWNNAIDEGIALARKEKGEN